MILTFVSHIQPFLYEPRGFSSIQEHDEAVVDRWNAVVSPFDTVFNLGDFCMNDVAAATKYISQLNGEIYWLRGNHCTDNKVNYICSECPNIHMLGYATVVKIHKYKFYLSHYPSMSANMDDSKKPWQRVYNLCGHSHTQDKWLHWDFGCYHCELDAHNCYPRNIEDILLDIKHHNLDKG